MHGVNGGALADSLLSCGGSVVASSAGSAAVFAVPPGAGCLLVPAPVAFFLRPARTGRQHYAPAYSCYCFEHKSRVAVQASHGVPKIKGRLRVLLPAILMCLLDTSSLLALQHYWPNSTSVPRKQKPKSI